MSHSEDSLNVTDPTQYLDSTGELVLPHFPLGKRTPINKYATAYGYSKTTPYTETRMKLHELAESVINKEVEISPAIMNKLLGIDKDNVQITQEMLNYFQGLTPSTFVHPLIPAQLKLLQSLLGSIRTKNPTAGVYHFRQTVSPFDLISLIQGIRSPYKPFVYLSLYGANGVGQSINLRRRLLEYNLVKNRNATALNR
jgi:hypothetical protein